MLASSLDLRKWADDRVRPGEIDRYLKPGGLDFVDEEAIYAALDKAKAPDAPRLQSLLDKSLAARNLDLDEIAELMAVTDPGQLERMAAAALAVKQRTYDKRIVAFAAIYLGNQCVNSCRYCEFRTENGAITRRVLSEAEIQSEVEVLAGVIGHKRVLAVYGEHPSTDADYIAESVKAILGVQVPVNGRWAAVHRVNVSAPPMPISELLKIRAAGMGTYQVFQETYERRTYAAMHPAGPKADYRWRLYALHRAMEAGVGDVGMGVLYGLHDWRFEVLATALHAADLELRFGAGPHGVNFPRLEPCDNTPLASHPPHPVSDEDFLRIVMIMRLALPCTGIVVTAREGAEVRRKALKLGVTQTDASLSVGVGAFHDGGLIRPGEHQRSQGRDSRQLEEVVREIAESGSLTSFCTAGLRCGRTGKCMTELLRAGEECRLCKVNAALTFKEWVDDFAGPKVQEIAARALDREIKEIAETLPDLYPRFRDYYGRTVAGERDLYF